MNSKKYEKIKKIINEKVNTDAAVFDSVDTDRNLKTIEYEND